MSSLYKELSNFTKDTTRELEGFADLVSTIDDMVQSLIQGIESGSVDNDDIIAGLEDIKKMLY